MKSYGRWIFVAALLFLWGCSITPTFTTGYRAEPKAEAQHPAGSLAVRQFSDQRPPKHYSTQGKLFVLYVPIVPYVDIDFERLDEIVPSLSAGVVPGKKVMGAVQNRAPEPPSTYAYPQSMAKAVADDLAAHKLFRSVEYVGEGAGEGHDYVLNGVLRATPVRQSATSFCLGMAGVLLWIAPIPMSKTTGEVKLDLTLTKTATNEVVWSQTVEADVSRLDTLYTTTDGILYGTSLFSYQMLIPPKDSQVDRDSIFAWNFEALRRGMEKAEPSLAAALASQ